MNREDNSQTASDLSGRIGDPFDAMKSEAAINGIRIVDFTWSVAGPTVTRILGTLGAEVIKVEWPAHPDSMRESMFAPEDSPTLENSPFFAGQSCGKRSLTVNARSEEGRSILEKLIVESDVVTESFSTGVLDRWGLSYERLREIKPDIIYLSVSGFGHTGPYQNYSTWGPTAQAFSGLTFASGLPGLAPAGWGYSYLDYMAGYQGALAVLAAIYRRRRTGKGARIDLSQAEVGLSLMAEMLADAQANNLSGRRSGFPPGNRSASPDGIGGNSYRGEIGVPYNSYATKGGGLNDYVVITVLDDDEWRMLCKCMGDPEWTERPEMATIEGRIQAQDEIDSMIQSWASNYEKYALMAKLQDGGVRCGAVQSSQNRMDDDPALRDRNVFPELTHPVLGTHRFEAVPLRFESSGPCTYEKCWPQLGQDNASILREVLGFSAEHIERLDREGITWPKGLGREIRVEKSLW